MWTSSYGGSCESHFMRLKEPFFVGFFLIHSAHPGSLLGYSQDNKADLPLFIFICVLTIFLESAQQLRLWRISCKLAKSKCDVTLGVVIPFSPSPAASLTFVLEHAQICTCKSPVSAGGQSFYASALLMSLPWIKKQVWTELFHSTVLTGPSCGIKQGHC